MLLGARPLAFYSPQTEFWARVWRAGCGPPFFQDQFGPSRFGVPALTFIVRVVPVRETLRSGTNFMMAQYI